jgi:hypothetical protein
MSFKELVYFLCFFTISFPVIGQHRDSFIQMVNQANHYLFEYARLSATEEKIPASSITLSTKEINEIINTSGYELTKSQATDSIYSYQAMEYVQKKIMRLINDIFRHPDFSKHDIQKLVKGEDCKIIKSVDNKLFNFSLDEKTGGTYRSKLSIVHFVDFLQEDSIQREEFQSFFDADGYDSIYTLQTDVGVKYLLKNSVRGCSSCFRNSIELIGFSENKFVREFEYAQESRNFNDGIYYDRTSKTIHVKYHLDDLSSECDCGKVNTKETTCICKFIFNGKTFKSAGQ